MSFFEVNNLSVRYGKTNALDNVSFSLEKGRIVSIIGANGAGKSSLLKAISALVKPVSGSISFEGTPLGNAPHQIVRRGIVHVPEGRRIFSSLSVEENLLCGAYLNKNGAEIQRLMDEQFETFPILAERRGQFGATLSGGEQQMLAISRAMMSSPKLLLLDEPSLGLAPLVVENVFEVVQGIRDKGVTVLLVEQNANLALSVADEAFVLEDGEITLSGSGKELLADPRVVESYLGTGSGTTCQ